MREFDTDMIKLIAAFENISKTEVRDCINNDSIYFLVNTGKIAIAIGKGGQTIKAAEHHLKKQIKIFEWAFNRPCKYKHSDKLQSCGSKAS